MSTLNARVLVLWTVVALIAAIHPGTASAAGKPGACFTLSPAHVFPNVDLSNEIGVNISTAHATVTDGILVSTDAAIYPAYSDGNYWVSETFSTLWGIGASPFEAFKRDFTNYYPTNRVWLTFYPDGVNAYYLAAYTSNGRLMKQITGAGNATDVLDTGYLKGKIGYVLASFSTGGRLGEMGVCIRWR